MTKAELTKNIRGRVWRSRIAGLAGFAVGRVIAVIALSIFVDALLLGVDFFPKDFSCDFTTAASPALGVLILSVVSTRTGGVLIAIYSIQVIVHLTKYNLRMVDHLQAMSNGVDYSDKDTSQTMPGWFRTGVGDISGCAESCSRL